MRPVDSAGPAFSPCSWRDVEHEMGILRGPFQQGRCSPWWYEGEGTTREKQPSTDPGHAASLGPVCWPGTEPLEMLKPDPSRQWGLCKYIPLISSAGQILCQGWKVGNQAPGLSVMQMGWQLQTHQETVPSAPMGLGGGCYSPPKHPLAFFCEICRMGEWKSGKWLEGEGEEVRGGKKAMTAGGGGERWEHKLEQSQFRGGVGGSEGSQWSVERWRRNEEWSECLHVSHGEQQQILMRRFSYYRSMSEKLPFGMVNKLTPPADIAEWCSKMKRAWKCQRS